MNLNSFDRASVDDTLLLITVPEGGREGKTEGGSWGEWAGWRGRKVVTKK